MNTFMIDIKFGHKINRYLSKNHYISLNESLTKVMGKFGHKIEEIEDKLSYFYLILL